MSTTADVLRDIDGLLKAVVALLNTDTAKELPNIARDLGAGTQFNQVIDGLAKALAAITAVVLPIRATVLQADSLVALVGIIPQVVATLGKAIDGAGADYARDLGLPSLASTTKDISGAIATASKALDLGEDVAEGIVEAAGGAGWQPLARTLKDVQDSVLALKVKPADSLPAAT